MKPLNYDAYYLCYCLDNTNKDYRNFSSVDRDTELLINSNTDNHVYSLSARQSRIILPGFFSRRAVVKDNT